MREDGSSLAIFGRRVGHHALIYATGPVIGVSFGLANVAILTRLLSRAEYGQLTLLLVFSSAVTLICNVGLIQGTTRAAYASSAQDGVAGPDDDLGTGEPVRRRTAGTGIVATAILGLVATAVVYGVAEAISSALLGSRHDARAAVLAAAVGGLTAVWRLTTNLLRLERRPAAWSVTNAIRPLLTLGAGAPLAAAGFGVSGVLIGWSAGTAASLAVALVVARRSFVLALGISDLRKIVRTGALLIPVIAGFWASENGDILILTHFISHASLAEYRVAGRMAAIVSFAGSAYLMAWGPISRDPIYLAAERERGQRPLLRMISTYLVVTVAAGVLFLACFAHVLIQIAPAAYASAALLIPLLGLRWAAKAFFQTTYRVSVHRSKLRLFAAFTVLNAIVAVVGGVVFAGRYGAYGVAAAAAAGPLVAAGAMLIAARLHGERGLIDYGRDSVAVSIAIACYLVVAAVAPHAGQYRIGLEVIAFIAYFPFLILARVIPRTHVVTLARRARNRTHAERQRDLHTRLEALDPWDRDILLALLAGVAIGDLAFRLQLSEDDVVVRFVQTMRVFAGLEGEGTSEPLLGRYLLWSGSAAARDVVARRLWSEGVDPREMEDLTRAFARARKEWTRLGRPTREALIVA